MRKKKHRKSLLLLFMFVIVLSFGLLGLKFASHVPLLYELVFHRGIDLATAKEDSITILFLGIGGGEHQGPELTDTIIFVHSNPQTKKVTLISIPRDLWIPQFEGKINASYARGERKQNGGGLVLTKAVVSSVLGQPVDYAVRIDFAGFVKAVDLIGGLDVTVERAFDDYEYPISGKETDPCGHKEEELESLATASSQLEAFPCRYEHLHFDQGPTHMDGAAALRFVRSRHAQGAEGSDFARSKRQEKIIAAFKDKLFSAGTLYNPSKMIGVYEVLKESIDTDIPEEKFDDFIRLAEKLKEGQLRSVTLDSQEGQDNDGFLINPPISDFNGQWVIIPRTGNGDFSEIQAFVACEITTGNCLPTQTPTKSNTGER